MASTGWLLLGVVVVTVAVSAAADAADVCTSSAGCHPDVARLTLTGTDVGQAMVVIMAVIAVTAEYRTGMIRATLAAVPLRTAVLAAKATVVTGLTLAAGAVAVLGSVLAGRLLLPGHGLTLPAGPMLRAAAGSVLYLVLIALQPGRGRRGARLRGGHRGGPRAAVPLPDPQPGGRPRLAAAPSADRADERRS